MTGLRDKLENQQVSIYFGAVVLAAITGLVIPNTTALEVGVNPALALMLFVTFLQVPLADLGRAVSRIRFLAALLITNFVVVPVLVTILIQFLPPDPMIRLGVLFVLLTPCIDYVVTFSHLGRADAQLLLAATPALLIVQMLVLPVYLSVFLGADAAGLVQIGPFVHAFVWLIAVPLVLAALVQIWASRSQAGERVATLLGVLPVPATALVLFVVVAAVVPQLGPAIDGALRVVPIYITFAVIVPLIGWGMARLFRLDVVAQFIGAFIGSFLVWLMYRPHFAVTEDQDLKLAVFCTGPGIRDAVSNLTSEIIGTFVLVFAVLFLAVSVFGLGALDALPVGLLVLAIGLSLGGTTGYAINPARDLGPRIMHAILPIPGGKRDSDWGYAWVPVIGPIIGAVLAGLLYLVLQDPSNVHFR